MAITKTHEINTLLSQQPQEELETSVNHFYDDLSNYKAEVSGTGTVSKETENNGKRNCDVTESKVECPTNGENLSERDIQAVLEEQPPAVPER